MKEICGFLDDKGQFHRTVKEVEKANNNYKIWEINDELRNINDELRYVMYKTSDNHRMSPEDAFKEEIYQGIVEVVLKNTDKFQAIIEKSKNLKKELDELHEKEEKDFISHAWWFKYKWW